jgi:2-polyprenyl-3-methyl-5-hydroxy-6-metoxy-1,4-benzoquinol methylase
VSFTPDGYRAALPGKVRLLLRLVEEEHGIDAGRASILDFGCHDGAVVEVLRRDGLDVSGFDVAQGKDTAAWGRPHIRYVDLARYAIPWPDASFDVVYSHHVLEHVADYGAALRELHRVLKPGGAMVHLFPSRWRVLEAHWLVPFGGVLHALWWCRLSRLAGLTKRGKERYSAAEYAQLAHDTIRSDTNYLSRRELLDRFGERFDDVRERAARYFTLLTGRRVAEPLSGTAEALLSTFHARVLLARKG